MIRTRFAPSTTGRAHPGTLLSAMLCWLDARSQGGEVWLRLEDLDPDRCRPELADIMIDDLDWLGLDWDKVERQTANRLRHEQATDVLAERGLLYPCTCSRSRIKALGVESPDGGYAYDNHCRNTPLPDGGWRNAERAVRITLPDERIHFTDEGGFDLSQYPAQDMGDPVVIRRDGAFAYHLACVVDDQCGGITRVIRGRDIAASAATQIQLQKLLGYPMPAYRHHFLFMERRGGKMAKFHGAVGMDLLREVYSPETLCGMLMHWSGVIDAPEPCRPKDLVDVFDWSRVRKEDMTLEWTGTELRTL